MGDLAAQSPPIRSDLAGPVYLRVGSSESEVELEVVEPWDVRVDALGAEFFGEAFVVGLQGGGGVVEGYEDGVIGDADVAIEAHEEALGEAVGLPAAIGLAEALAQLVDGRLGGQGQGQMSVSDVEVQGSGAAGGCWRPSRAVRGWLGRPCGTRSRG